jgi:hypothetical protein
MHWLTRATIAAAAGGLTLGLPAAFLPSTNGVIPGVATTLDRTGVQTLGYYLWYSLGEYPVLIAVYLLPAILIAAVGYTLATLQTQARELEDGPRCKRCGYILRGLPEPRCPECGERA